MKVNRLMVMFVVPVILALLVGLGATALASDEAEMRIDDGTVTATKLMEDGTGWIKVNGVGVVIDAETEVNTDAGDLVEGAIVDVEGMLHHGYVFADRVEVNTFEEGDELDHSARVSDGTITMGLTSGKMGDFIKVNGLKVFVTAETEVNGELVEGAEVDVEGTLNMGKLWADKISAAALEVEEEEEAEEEE